jgi:Na+/melibiose symporter-like transporter
MFAEYERYAELGITSARLSPSGCGAGGLAGFGLTLIGYVADAEQTPGTLLGIKALQTLYPCVAFFIAAAILIFLYPLTDARY